MAVLAAVPAIVHPRRLKALTSALDLLSVLAMTWPLSRSLPFGQPVFKNVALLSNEIRTSALYPVGRTAGPCDNRSHSHSARSVSNRNERQP
jgi:hypothetical protein